MIGIECAGFGIWAMQQAWLKLIDENLPFRMMGTKPNFLSFRPESFGICKALQEPQQMPKDVAENCEAPANSFEGKALMSKSCAY